jgi:hypothetical protein
VVVDLVAEQQDGVRSPCAATGSGLDPSPSSGEKASVPSMLITALSRGSVYALWNAVEPPPDCPNMPMSAVFIAPARPGGSGRCSASGSCPACNACSELITNPVSARRTLMILRSSDCTSGVFSSPGITLLAT